MRFVNTFYLIGVFLLLACNGGPKEKTRESLANVEPDIHQELNYIAPIDDAELVMNWVNEILTSNYLKSQFIKSQDTVRNSHDRNQLDTVNYYKTARSQIVIYVTPSKNLLLETNLYDSDVSLSEKIKIGVDKAVVFDVLNQKFANDTIIIQEPDGYGIYFELFFKDKKLDRIHYKSEVD